MFVSATGSGERRLKLAMSMGVKVIYWCWNSTFESLASDTLLVRVHLPFLDQQPQCCLEHIQHCQRYGRGPPQTFNEFKLLISALSY